MGDFAQLNSMEASEPVLSIPKPRRSLRERALTAFHEAGHAVVAHLFAYPFDSVEVYTEPREDDNGRLVGFKSQFDPFSVVSLVVEREAVILLAGPVATAIKAGRSDPKHGGSDFRLALFMAQHEREGKSSFELVAHLNYLLANTMRLLSDPVVWRAVELVGMELSTRKSLSSEEVGKAVEQAKTESKDMESFRADRLVFERTESLMRKFLRRGIDAVIKEAGQL